MLNFFACFFLLRLHLVAHVTAIGDTIAVIGPCSAIASRRQLVLRQPSLIIRVPFCRYILHCFRITVVRWPRFGSATIPAHNSSNGSGFRFGWFLFGKAFYVFLHCLTQGHDSGSGVKNGSDGSGSAVSSWKVRKAPDTLKFWRHDMRALLSVRPKCSHRCVSLKESPSKPVEMLQHATRI